MNNHFVEAAYGKKGFTCFECGAFSQHRWDQALVDCCSGYITKDAHRPMSKSMQITTCMCEKCRFISVWKDGAVIYPIWSNVEPPLEDMPEQIKELYNEARNVLSLSPKSACALLRLALQILCNDLNGTSADKNLNDTIGDLVGKGLPQRLSNMMDFVRVIGNEAVHPGEINIDDNVDIAYALFGIINMIIEKLIIEPKELDALYGLLPEEKRRQIEKRNEKVMAKK